MRTFIIVCFISVFCVFGMVSYLLMANQQERNWWINHTNQIISQANVAQASLYNADALFLRYMVTKQERFKVEYETEVNISFLEIDKIKLLITDNPEQIARYEQLLFKFKDRLKFQATLIDPIQIADSKNNHLRFDVGYVIQEIIRRENDLLRGRQEAYMRALIAECFFAGFGSLFMIILAFWAGIYYNETTRQASLNKFAQSIKK